MPASNSAPGEATASVGSLLIDIGRPKEAVYLLTRAVEFVHPDRAVNDVQTGLLAVPLGLAWMRADNLAKAKGWFDYAVTKLTEAFGVDHPMTAAALRRLGYCEVRLGERESARLTLRQSRAGTLRQRHAVRHAAVPASARLAAHHATFYDDEMLFSLEMAHALANPAGLPDLVALQLQRKGAVLDAMLPVPGNDGPETALLRAQLSAAAGELARAYQALERNPTAEARSETDRLTALRDRLEGDLMPRSARLRDEKAEAGLDLAALCRGLPKRALLLDFVLYLDYQPIPNGMRLTMKLAALAVEQDGCKARLVDLGEAKPVQTLVQAWRKTLNAGGSVRGAAALGDDAAKGVPDWHEGAKALYLKILQPFAAELARAKLLVVSPDADLHFVPFAALQAPDGRLLADHVAVALVDSVRHLARAGMATAGKDKAVTASVGQGALVLGGATFGVSAGAPTLALASQGGGGCPTVFQADWADLPGTQVEALAVAQQLRAAKVPVELRKGEDANEATFKRLAPGRRYLAVATHGWFAPAACARDDDMQPRDPLLLSGLVLAGANRRAATGEDGWLTAAEIAALDLRSVELVVLSACETGLGDANQAVGEGVFGLRRAFARAGAAGVVMSLWQVPDKETAELMSRFWTGVATCKGADCSPWTALRDAQRDLRMALVAAGGEAHPYLWAAFVYSGVVQ